MLVRTTIRIDDELYRRAKALAAQSQQTVADLIEDAVRMALTPRPPAPAGVAPLPVFGGSGVMPGVDLAGRGALLDLMEQGSTIGALR